MRLRSAIVLGFAMTGLVAITAVKVYGVVSRTALGPLAGSPMAPILRGDPAPAFRAPDMTGREVALADLRGRLVILNFWFTGCEPCREEMPSLDTLARRFGGRGVEVIALSVDPDWDKVKKFLASDLHLQGRTPAYRILLDAGKTVPQRYGTFKYPETFLISKGGNLIARFVGPRDWASPEASRLIESLLH